MSVLSTKDIVSKTLFFEKIRAVIIGIFFVFEISIGMLLANRVFGVGYLAKSMLRLGEGAGYFLSPILVNVSKRNGWKVTTPPSFLYYVSGTLLLLTVIFDHPYLYVLSVLTAITTGYSSVPFIAQLYRTNLPKDQIGQLGAKIQMFRVFSVIIFGIILSQILSMDIAWYRWILLFFALAAFLAGWAIQSCPAEIEKEECQSIWAGLKHFKQDKAFFWLVLCWMFHTFSYHVSTALIMEYFSNPQYGLLLTPFKMTLFLAIIPFGVMVFTTMFVGRLFDKINFLWIQLLTETTMIMGTLCFLFGPNDLWRVIGSFLIGMEECIYFLTFGLWVTKLAPPNKVSEYSSINGLLCSLGVLVAPILTFQLLEHGMSIATGGFLYVIINLLAIACLGPAALYYNKKIITH
jgi:hypothetical protein